MPRNPVSEQLQKIQLPVFLNFFVEYGHHVSLTSYNVSQFVPVEFKTLLNNHGIKDMLSAPHYPATNSHAGSYMQIIKRGLKALAPKSSIFQIKFNGLLLQYRKMPHFTTGEESSAALFLKRHIRRRRIVPNVTHFIFKGKRLYSHFVHKFLVGNKEISSKPWLMWGRNEILFYILD